MIGKTPEKKRAGHDRHSTREKAMVSIITGVYTTCISISQHDHVLYTIIHFVTLNLQNVSICLVCTVPLEEDLDDPD